MPITVFTTRDTEILTALARVPLATEQLVKLSQTFHRPFRHDRLLRRRMAKLVESGLVCRATYTALAGRGGTPNYYLLTPMGHRLLVGPEIPPPSERFGKPIAVTRHFHSFALAEAIVHILIAAHRAGCKMIDYWRENTVRLSDGHGSIYPDASFQLVTPAGETYSYFLELDNATERLESRRYDETWERKIAIYEAMRDRAKTRFRVLVVASKPGDRLLNILDLAGRHASNPHRTLFCGVRLAELLATRSALTEPVFKDHRGRSVAMLPWREHSPFSATTAA